MIAQEPGRGSSKAEGPHTRCGAGWSDSSVPHACELIADVVGTTSAFNGEQDRATMAQDEAEIPGMQGSTSGNGEAGAGRAESIKVLVRVRPLVAAELGPERHATTVVDVDEQADVVTVRGAAPSRRVRCRYDAALGPETTQNAMYDHVRDAVAAVLDGINSTVFAYGQTGSGKTHTMFGPNGDASLDASLGPDAGVVPRAVTDLFQGLARAKEGDAGGNKVSVWCSLLQIYNEHLYDMLRDPQRAHPLTIHEESETGIYVQGLSEYAVHCAGDCLQILRVGGEHRAIRETHMNQASSRSHSILQLVVEQKRASEADGERVLRSKFNLVDLAGSEKWDVKQDMEEARLNEMTNINVSLYTLGRVIAALSAKGGQKRHVPYRDSKLTRLLQDSLGGNTLTRIIATLSPASDCAEETVSTLRFADRAKQVLMFVRVNEHRPVDYALVLRLQAEVKHLRSLLRELTDKHAQSDGQGASPALLEAQLIREKEESERLREENARLRRQVDAGGEQHPARQPRSPSSAQVQDWDTHGATGASMDMHVAGLQAANSALEAALGEVNVGLRAFFRFEIEEDELREAANRTFARVSSVQGDGHKGAPPMPAAAHAAAPVQASDTGGGLAVSSSVLPRAGEIQVSSSPATSGGAMSPGEGDLPAARDAAGGSPRAVLPPVPAPPRARVALISTGGVQALPPAAQLAYRVRGKRSDQTEIVSEAVTEEEEERRLRLELKKAKERVKKNLELQEWLRRQQDREAQALREEAERREAFDRERKIRDGDFRRHAAKQKAKLKRYYEGLRAEARREADTVYLNSSELLQSMGDAVAI